MSSAKNSPWEVLNASLVPQGDDEKKRWCVIEQVRISCGSQMVEMEVLAEIDKGETGLPKPCNRIIVCKVGDAWRIIPRDDIYRFKRMSTYARNSKRPCESPRNRIMEWFDNWSHWLWFNCVVVGRESLTMQNSDNWNHWLRFRLRCSRSWVIRVTVQNSPLLRSMTTARATSTDSMLHSSSTYLTI